ncbi:ParB/RepB/Spo0J family partition protein [Variovorax sp. UMC13]|uniref:ParB/RepB/Spo0J family partition protein n=1 Tax=Variovorax sp. UMC13 TaxID=1862326 RepID=UPI001602D20C|nr:ParB/RepB/Spo0J family partition protein [Variovorax sp. UMC13]MBB1601252.1 hypothetical protein [Variovorax sp. UMC13]
MSLKEFSAGDGAAIAEQPEADTAVELFAMLDLALVAPSLTNPRKTFNEAKMQDLVESIKASGVHQPILVRPLPPSRLDDTFRNRGDGNPLPTHEIVSGERRYRASKLAQQKTIPAMIRQLSDAAVLEIQIVENLQRDDLTELEEAEGYQRLCDETGLLKEAVGDRIGKSRAYVYSRLKLLELTAGPREALRRGDIDGSKALLIARIPDEKLQIKALEAANEKDHQGSPRLSYRALQSWVQQNVMLKLSAAKFSIVDAGLLPAAGDCNTCTKRTGANPDLFADVDGPDLCIDPPCFHGKETAHTEALIAVARAKGMEVIEGKEAMELQPHKWYGTITGYSELTQEMRDALPERELKGKVKLFVSPHSNEVKEIVADALAEKARGKAQAKGGKVDAAMAKQAQKQKEREAAVAARDLAEAYQTRWRAAAIAAIEPRIRAGEIRTLSANLLRRVLLEISMADQRCGESTFADVIGLPERYPSEEIVLSSVRSLDDNEVGYTLLLVLLQGDATASWDYEDDVYVFNDSAPTIDDLALQLDISIDEIKAKVQAEIRAERGAEATASDEPAAQAEGSAKGVEKKSKPAARAPRAKTSPEEASASIAAALQALDAEPAGASEPAGEVAARIMQVADRIRVVDEKEPTHGLEGAVTRIFSNGQLRIVFDDRSTATLPPAAVECLAAALWPEPAGLDPRAAWPFPKEARP